MKAGKKIENRLAERQKGYKDLLAMRSDSKVQSRKESGGYTLPGSRKKNG